MDGKRISGGYYETFFKFKSGIRFAWHEEVNL